MRARQRQRRLATVKVRAVPGRVSMIQALLLSDWTQDKETMVEMKTVMLEGDMLEVSLDSLHCCLSYSRQLLRERKRSILN